MNLREIRAQVREWLDDDRQPYLWSDMALNSYVNQAVTEAVIRVEGIKDDSTTAICTIAVTTPTAEYTLDSRILEVTRAKLASQSRKLNETSIWDLDTNVAFWETYPASTTTHYYADTTLNKIRLFPAPSTNDTLSLMVLRLPLTDLVTETDTPELEVRHHPGLAHWACFLAYQKRDADANDMAKSAHHDKEFTRWVGPKKDVRDQDFTRFFVPRQVRRRNFR